MRYCTLCLFVLLFTIVSLKTSLAADIAIIVHPSVQAQEVSAEDLRSVFLGTKTSLRNGSHLRPILEKPGPTHSAFLRAIVGKTDFALQTYYRGLVFSGKWSIPRTFNSDAEIIAYVSRTPGAIGYVDASSVAQGVKTLRVR